VVDFAHPLSQHSPHSRTGHRPLEHGGSWQGFKTHISRYVDDKLTVVVLTNLGDAESGKITQHVAETYLSTSGNPVIGR
jgi:hypothetical protein